MFDTTGIFKIYWEKILQITSNTHYRRLRSHTFSHSLSYQLKAIFKKEKYWAFVHLLGLVVHWRNPMVC